MEQCNICNGLGSISSSQGFLNGGELPQDSKTCIECNGSGFVMPTYFVEFTFKNHLSTYWFPLFIRAANTIDANKLLIATRKGLEEKYTEVNHSKIIPKIEHLTNDIIQSKFLTKRIYKLAKLNINMWNFVDIENNPELSFNEHIEFIMDNLPLYSRTIAERVGTFQFPVRVIRSDFKTEFEDYLLVDVVKVG